MSVIQRCLEHMAAHFQKFGGIWEKTARNVLEELEQFSTWDAHDKEEEWRDVTLYDLQAAYWWRIRKMEEIEYVSITTAYREERFIGTLIKEAPDQTGRIGAFRRESAASITMNA